MTNIQIAGLLLCPLILSHSVGSVAAGPKGYSDRDGPSIFAALFYDPIEIPECGETDDTLEQIDILRGHMNNSERFNSRGRGQVFDDGNGRRIPYTSVSRLCDNLRLRNLEDMEKVLPLILDPDPKIRVLVGSVCQKYPGNEQMLFGMGYWSVLARGDHKECQSIIDSITEFVAKERAN